MDPDSRRAQILGAARDVFARKGYHGTGVADIIEAIGVARGTFYNYFDGKREAFDAVVEAMMDEVVAVVRPIDVTTDIPTQVRANLDRLVRAVMDEDVVRVLFSEAVGIDEDGDAVLRRFYRDVLARIEKALRTGQHLGVVREGDVSLKARCVLGVIKEPVLQSALFGEDLDVDALVAELIALLSGGLLVAPASRQAP